MPISTGVSMNASYLFPYIPGMKNVIAVSYINNLSDNAKRKLLAYNLYKYDKLKMTTIAKRLNVHASTISRWIKQVTNTKRARRYQLLEPKSRRPKHTPRRRVLTPEIKKRIIEIRRKLKYGKDKIAEQLKIQYGYTVSASTVHRFITSLPQSKEPRIKYLRSKVKVRTRGNKNVVRYRNIVHKLKHKPFELIQIDTKYFTISNKTFYIITAIDTVQD